MYLRPEYWIGAPFMKSLFREENVLNGKVFA